MTAATADLQNPNAEKQERQVPLPLRNDTFLGVCEAIGRDVGFNPNWLRIAFGLLILVNPMAAVGAYLSLGLVVAIAHWLFPANKLAGRAQNDGLEAADDNNEAEERLAA